jgi:hypothetical protein
MDLPTVRLSPKSGTLWGGRCWVQTSGVWVEGAEADSKQDGVQC